MGAYRCRLPLASSLLLPVLPGVRYNVWGSSLWNVFRRHCSSLVSPVLSHLASEFVMIIPNWRFSVRCALAVIA